MKPTNKPPQLKPWSDCHHTAPDRKTYTYNDGTQYEVCSICNISRRLK